MSRGALAVLLALTACGSGAPKTPELLQRELPSGKVEPVKSNQPYVDPLDAGGGFVDAGCCNVQFALRASAGEIDARLVFADQSYPMDQSDAGIWQGTACRQPKPDRFYFQVGFYADDDAGILYVDRVNNALPVDLGGAVAPEVNVFEVADGGVCASIDAPRYVSLPDAG